MPAGGFRRFVKIPKTGRRIDLARARETLLRRIDWLNAPASEQRRLLLKQLQEFDALARVVDVFNKTRSYPKAADAGEVSQRTVREWVGGERLPRNVSPARENFYSRKRKPLTIRPERQADFAYVLGAMMGNASRYMRALEQAESRINLSVSDRGFAENFRRKLYSSTGIRVGPIKKRNGLFVVDIGTRNLIQLFNESTGYSKHPPAKFLVSMEARRRFVQAVYDSRGNIVGRGRSKTATVIVNPLNKALTTFIAMVLLENGFHPRVIKGEKIVLPGSETKKFMDTIGFNKKTKISA